MSWIDLSGDDLASVSYRRSGVYIDRQPGPAVIVADTKSRTKGDHVLYLRVPMDLHERVKRLVEGSNSVALVAIIEDALNRLEEGNETWRVLTSPGQH